MDAEYLAEVQAIDARYHLARMIAQGFNGGAQVIWDERNDWRTSVLTPAARQTDADTLLAAGAALWQRALAKGIIPPPSGAN